MFGYLGKRGDVRGYGSALVHPSERTASVTSDLVTSLLIVSVFLASLFVLILGMTWLESSLRRPDSRPSPPAVRDERGSYRQEAARPPRRH